MKNVEIKVVVLDWSGTVSDDRRCVWLANVAVLRMFGKPDMTFEEWLPRTTLTAAEILHNHGVNGYPEHLNRLYSQELARVKKDGVKPEVYLEAKDTLMELSARGFGLAVLSSHPRTHLLVEAGDFGLAGLLSMLVGDSTDKAVDLAKIAIKMQVRKREILYVGYTIFDIQAAKKAGVASGAICQGYHTRDRLEAENPDFLFNSLREIPEVISRVSA